MLGGYLYIINVTFLLIIELSFIKHLNHTYDAIHRGANLVTHVSQKIRFHLIVMLRLPLFFLQTQRICHYLCKLGKLLSFFVIKIKIGLSINKT